MEPATRKLYIDVNHPAPDRQTLPTRFLPQEGLSAPVPASDESPWKRLLKLLPFN